MRALSRKKIILQVPYYHQLDPATGLLPQFRNNGCAIVCLKMVLEYILEREFNISTLYEAAEASGGRNPKGDWTHAAEVRVLKHYQLVAWRRNWNLAKADIRYFKTKENYNAGQLQALEQQNQNAALLAILTSLMSGFPVIASVKKHFAREGKRHQVVIIGFDEDHLYINDPIAKDPANHPLVATQAEFLQGFNYQAIFVSRDLRLLFESSEYSLEQK